MLHRDTFRIAPRLAVIALAVVFAVAGCGGDDDTDADAQGPETENSEPNDAADPDDGDAKSDAGDSNGGEIDPWRRSAQQVDFGEESTAEVECPARGTEHVVWGSEIYTDDSSICTAAVHAGLIDFDEGGTVEIEQAPGEESYEGTEANGVTTRPYGAWPGSFTFVD